MNKTAYVERRFLTGTALSGKIHKTLAHVKGYKTKYIMVNLVEFRTRPDLMRTLEKWDIITHQCEILSTSGKRPIWKPVDAVLIGTKIQAKTEWLRYNPSISI